MPNRIKSVSMLYREVDWNVPLPSFFVQVYFFSEALKNNIQVRNLINESISIYQKKSKRCLISVS